MNKEELIILGKKIIEAQGAEEEVDNMIELFNKNVPYPNGANLFFYPENYNARKDNLGNYSPTVEEVVDKCINYKPIRL